MQTVCDANFEPEITPLKTTDYEISHGILIHSHKYTGAVCFVDTECNTHITIKDASSVRLCTCISMRKFVIPVMTMVLLNYGYE
jgi:hypothetical protein